MTLVIDGCDLRNKVALSLMSAKQDKGTNVRNAVFSIVVVVLLIEYQ